jgi:Flp pilus assembly protein TadD
MRRFCSGNRRIRRLWKGLANVRLQMNNKVGAIEPLEKLVKLNPNRADYKALLGQVRQQMGRKKIELIVKI